MIDQSHPGEGDPIAEPLDGTDPSEPGIEPNDSMPPEPLFEP